jgi:DNA polymerase kappa
MLCVPCVLLQLVFVKPDFSKYTAASAQAFAVFRAYDAAVEGASLDEAYLDVTQYCSAHGMTGEQVCGDRSFFLHVFSLRLKYFEQSRLGWLM